MVAAYPALETTQGQIHRFLSQLTFKLYRPETPGLPPGWTGRGRTWEHRPQLERTRVVLRPWLGGACDRFSALHSCRNPARTKREMAFGSTVHRRSRAGAGRGYLGYGPPRHAGSSWKTPHPWVGNSSRRGDYSLKARDVVTTAKQCVRWCRAPAAALASPISPLRWTSPSEEARSTANGKTAESGGVGRSQ